MKDDSQLYAKSIPSDQGKNRKQTPVEWLLNWMEGNRYFIGNDLLEAVEKAKDMDETDSVDDYMQGYEKGWIESNKHFREDVTRLYNKYHIGNGSK